MIWVVYSILSLIWGSTWLAIKIGLEDSPPLWSAGLRFAVACLILFLINLYRKTAYPKRIKEIAKVAMPGIFMYTISYITVYHGEQYIDSSLMSVLFASFPFFVAGMSLIMLRTEKLSLIAWLGLIIGFGGIIMIFFDSLNTSTLVFEGALMGVIAAASASFGSIYIRAYLRNYDIYSMAFIQLLAGTILILMAAVLFEPITLFKVTVKSVSALLYLSVFGTVIAFLSYYWLLNRIPVIIVSLITFITPVLAIALGYLFRTETFSVETAIGAGLVLVGVVLITVKKKK